MKKRILSILLTFAMLLTLTPAVFAEDTTTGSDTTVEDTAEPVTVTPAEVAPAPINLIRNDLGIRDGVSVTSAGDSYNSKPATDVIDGNGDNYLVLGGVPAYIQIDLGEAKTITKIDYKVQKAVGGNTWRDKRFKILVSDDPNFTTGVETVAWMGNLDSNAVISNVIADLNGGDLTGKISGETEVSNLDSMVDGVITVYSQPKKYRYVRVQSFQNELYNDNSSYLGCAELSVYGYGSETENLTAKDGVTATSPNGQHSISDGGPEVVLDGKYIATLNSDGSTDVAAEGYTAYVSNFGQTNPYVQIDLGAVKEISQIKVLPFRGVEADASPNTYYRNSLMIKVSNDPNFTGNGKELIWSGSVGLERDAWLSVNLSSEDYNTYRYVRIMTYKRVIGLAEVEVYGLDTDIDVEYLSNIGNGATNIDTYEIPQLVFNQPVDPDTLENGVYAVKADGTKVDLRTVVLDEENTTVGVDIYNLQNGTTYRICVDGVTAADGTDLSAFESNDFVPGVIAPAQWQENTKLINVAKNAEIVAMDATNTEGVITYAKGADIGYMTDGDLTGNSSDRLTAGNGIDKYEEETPNYGYINLGGAYKIELIGAYGAACAWHYAPLTAYGTNTAPETLTAPTAGTLLGSYSQPGDVSNQFQTMAVSDENAYQYVILTSTNGFGPNEMFVIMRVNRVDVVENISIPETVKGLTNVSNTIVNFGSDNVSYINNGAPIKIQLADTVDMSTVTNQTLKLVLVKDGTETTIGYTPIKDEANHTVSIDLSELSDFIGTGTLYNDAPDNRSYKIVITNDVKQTDKNETLEKTLSTFTTGMIAKAPYQTGKVIKNVAANKTGVLKGETVTTTQFTDRDRNWRKQITEQAPLMIDLGNTYQIASIGMTVQKYPWHLEGAGIIVSEEANYEWDSVDATIPYVNPYNQSVTALSAAKAGRYVYVTPTKVANDGVDLVDIYPSEVFVYAYVDEGAADVYFTSTAAIPEGADTAVKTIAANADNAGSNTLIIAEYDGDKLIQAHTGNGAGITYTAGNTYKAFLWNSLSGLTPVIDAMEYEPK